MIRCDRLFVIIGGLALLACGGDGDPPTFSTGLDSTTNVSELSASEAFGICEQSAELLQTFYQDLVSDKTVLCTVAGVLAGDESTCQMVVDVCLETDLEGSPTPEIEADCEMSADLSDCDVTVGEVETCFNAQLALFNDAFRGLDCSQAGRTDLFEDPGGRGTRRNA